jgi:hypothetical protein
MFEANGRFFSAPTKATSSGWAREIAIRNLTIASRIAAAHLSINA